MRKANNRGICVSMLCPHLMRTLRPLSVDIYGTYHLLMKYETHVLTSALRQKQTYNRDDHSKNFTFLMDPSGEWKVSPAYDLTFSSGPGGEQSMMVLGEGKAPQPSDLRKLGETFSIKLETINTIIDQTREALMAWPELAKDYGVSATTRKLISSRINP